MESLSMPPPDGDVNRGTTVLIFYWTLFAVEVIFVSLRFYARQKTHALGLDDWTIAIALMIMLGCIVSGSMYILAGGCRHFYYVARDSGIDGLTKVSRLWYILQPFSVIALAVARISVAILILRFLGQSKWRRYFLYFSIISTFTISGLVSILLFTACSPPKLSWQLDATSHCWNPIAKNDMFVFWSSWNVFIDFSLALLPITIFRKLHFDTRKKVWLCVLMGMGSVAGISCAIKIPKLKEATSNDPTWATFNLLMWTGAETFLIIVCGCIPTLKPVYIQIFKPHQAKSSKASAPSPSPDQAHQVRIIASNKHSNDNNALRLGDRQKSTANLVAAHQILVRTDISQSDNGSRTIYSPSNNNDEELGCVPRGRLWPREGLDSPDMV